MFLGNTNTIVPQLAYLSAPESVALLPVFVSAFCTASTITDGPAESLGAFKVSGAAGVSFRTNPKDCVPCCAAKFFAILATSSMPRRIHGGSSAPAFCPGPTTYCLLAISTWSAARFPVLLSLVRQPVRLLTNIKTKQTLLKNLMNIGTVP